MRKLNNNLDERQEQKLLQIEHNACWIAFWGLAASILLQGIIFGWQNNHTEAEMIILMIMAVYIGGDCARNGIWDRHLKPDARTNFYVALIAAAVMGVFTFIRIFSGYPDYMPGCIAGGVVTGIFTFIATFILLSAAAAYTKKIEQNLEEESEDKTL